MTLFEFAGWAAVLGAVPVAVVLAVIWEACGWCLRALRRRVAK